MGRPSHAKRVALKIALPFDITKQSAGAQKAYANMVKFYGQQKGTQVFIERAEQYGTGNTLREKVNSVYKKGARLNAAKGA